MPTSMLLLRTGVIKNFMHFHLSASSPNVYRKSDRTERTEYSLLLFGQHRRGSLSCYNTCAINLGFCPDLLKHPSHSRPHPLHKKLHLMVCPVLGEPSAAISFQKKLPMCSWPLGGQARRNSTEPILTNGWRFAVRGRLLSIHHH